MLGDFFGLTQVSLLVCRLKNTAMKEKKHADWKTQWWRRRSIPKIRKSKDANSLSDLSCYLVGVSWLRWPDSMPVNKWNWQLLTRACAGKDVISTQNAFSPWRISKHWWHSKNLQKHHSHRIKFSEQLEHTWLVIPREVIAWNSFTMRRSGIQVSVGAAFLLAKQCSTTCKY